MFLSSNITSSHDKPFFTPRLTNEVASNLVMHVLVAGVEAECHGKLISFP